MKSVFTTLLIFVSVLIHAQVDIMNDLLNQEQKKTKEYVAYTFKSTRIINGHSIEMVKKNALDFQVSHRFGDIAASNNDHIHNLFGFDQATDISLLFWFENVSWIDGCSPNQVGIALNVKIMTVVINTTYFQAE